MPELEDIAWAGYQEFARQWILVSRRERYIPGSGVHNLWFSTGGSQGHGGEWGIDVYEGDRECIKTNGRIWECSLVPVTEARNAAVEQRDKVKEEKDATRLEANRSRICNAMAKYPQGETKNIIKGVCSINQQGFLLAWASLFSDDSIIQTLVQKDRKKPWDGWKLSDLED